MNEHWRSFLESTEAHFSENTDQVLDFGDPGGELQAAGRQTLLVPLTHLAVIDAAGDDAKTFLHSQFTSDINALAQDEARHAGWCTPKGRLLASFIVRRQAQNFRLLLAADLLAYSEKRLRMYVLRSKVTLTAQTDCALLGLAGAQLAESLAAAGLTAPESALHSQQHGEIEVLRLDTQRVIVICPLTQAPDIWAQLAGKARPVGLPVWRWLDIENALPLVTQATQEAFVPQMLDLEKIGGLSFNKGCYPGQEIVARTQYLGKVKRHLYRVSGAENLAAGAELFSPDNPDQAVGQIVSGASAPTGGFAGLAVIQANFAGNVRLGSREGAALTASAVYSDQ
ncbi:MAG: YgfZ/GcvT domain-containing protein [Azonexus sp.]